SWRRRYSSSGLSDVSSFSMNAKASGSLNVSSWGGLPWANFQTSSGELARALQVAVDPPAGDRVDDVAPTGDGECRQQAVEIRCEVQSRKEWDGEEEDAAEDEQTRWIAGVWSVRADTVEQPEHAGDPETDDDDVHDKDEELIRPRLLGLAIQRRRMSV